MFFFKCRYRSYLLFIVSKILRRRENGVLIDIYFTNISEWSNAKMWAQKMGWKKSKSRRKKDTVNMKTTTTGTKVFSRSTFENILTFWKSKFWNWEFFMKNLDFQQIFWTPWKQRNYSKFPHKIGEKFVINRTLAKTAKKKAAVIWEKCYEKHGKFLGNWGKTPWKPQKMFR